MIKKTNTKIWLIISYFVITIFVIFSKIELYPFAPYTMYSYVHLPNRFTMVQIYLINEQEEKIVVDEDIHPFDESRAKKIFLDLFWGSEKLSEKELKQKVYEALRVIYLSYKRNAEKMGNAKYTGIKIEHQRWGSLDAIRNKKYEYRKEVGRYEHL